eukprot:5513537-Amphidinium_carterae.1
MEPATLLAFCASSFTTSTPSCYCGDGSIALVAELSASYAMLRGWMLRLQGLEHAWASRLVRVPREPIEPLTEYFIRRRRIAKAAVADA